MNTRLALDLIRLNRLPAVVKFADLVSNYDLVAHSIASLALQRADMPKGPIKAMFTTLQDMEHVCRTAFGDSTESYGGEIWAIPLKPPPQGLGQGNGAAPTIWALVSTPLLDSLRKEGHGLVFKCNISQESFHLVGYAFVDDTTLVSVAPSPDWSTGQVMQRAQEALDIYVGGVAATGGTVHPVKTKWYLVEFKFDKSGRLHYVDNEARLTVSTRHGRQEIERLPTSAASRILGVHLAPDGNQRDQVLAMRRKTETWADRVRSGHIQRQDAWHYLQTTIKRSLLYPLLATTLTEKDCVHIEAPALEAALQACGMPSNMPREVVYGPERYLGLNHGSIYHTQGAKHIQALMDFGETATITGHQIRALIEGHKVELGVGGTLFENDWSRFHCCVTSTWVSDTWRYLWQQGIRLVERTPTLSLQRESDCFIMECFAMQGYSPEKLDRLNRCRRHLQVVTLSDITTGDGTTVLAGALAGIKSFNQHDDLGWPLQPSPARRLWQEWRRAMEETFRLDKHDRLPLLRRLGPWLPSAKMPSAILVESEVRLYVKEDGNWTVHARQQRRGRSSSNTFRRTEMTVPEPPTGSEATNYSRKGSTIFLTGSAPRAEVEENNEQAPSSFLSRCLLSRPEIRWALEACNVDDDGRYVAAAIKSGTAIAVSDGSFKDAMGSAAFVIEGTKWRYGHVAP